MVFIFFCRFNKIGDHSILINQTSIRITTRALSFENSVYKWHTANIAEESTLDDFQCNSTFKSKNNNDFRCNLVCFLATLGQGFRITNMTSVLLSHYVQRWYVHKLPYPYLLVG
jgi:hypothetical protein